MRHEASYKDIKVSVQWLARCENGLQADTRGASSPWLPRRGEEWREGKEVVRILALCVKSVYLSIFFFLLSSLTHKHVFWYVYAMCLCFHMRVRQPLSSRQDSLTQFFLPLLTTCCLGTCWLLTHMYTHTHARAKVSLLGNLLAICLFIHFCQQQVREEEKAKSKNKY